MKKHLLIGVMLPWALWAYVETNSVPAKGDPWRGSNVLARFTSYEECDDAAKWSESQPDMREDFRVDQMGQRWRSTMTYECRQSGETAR